MSDERDAIRARIDIVDLVTRDGIRLKKTGKHFSGLCPFHDDKNPSFQVSSETGRYRCFACGAKGDIFDWVMKRQNLDFVEALTLLAQEAGVELKGGKPESAKSERIAHQNAMEIALKFFQDQFHRSTAAQNYCQNRGIDAETLANWKVGYAPDVGEALAMFLRKQGVSLSEARSLFLVDQDAGGGYFDKFRGRLIFPIHDERGAVVAFGGRLLGDGHPKYINSGDTPLYRKSRVLYGMNRARDALTKTRRAVLCEGYLDVIACHRAGIETAVASLGTSLTDEHAKLLKRWSDEVVILYDADNAGQKAADRAIDVLRPEGLRIRIALMPDGEDPDTLLRKKGPEAVRQAVDSGLSPVDYRLHRLEKELPPDHPDYWKTVYEAIAESESEPDVDIYIERFAGKYPGVRDVVRAHKAIRVEVDQLRRSKRASADRKNPSSTPRKVGRAPVPDLDSLIGPEVVIFQAFLSESFRRPAFMFARHKQLFQSARGQYTSEAIAAAFASPPEGPPRQWLPRLSSEVAIDTLERILTSPVGSGPISEDALAEAIQALQRKMAARRKIEAWRQGTDKNAVFQQIKQSNPDLKAQKSTDGDGFF